MGIESLKFGGVKKVIESALLASVIACGHVQKEVNTDVNETMSEDFKVNAPRLLEKGKIDQKRFFEMLGKVQEIHELIPSENPDAPIFIILPDEHGSPKIEEAKLNNLREKLGINFVGVEGWAGKKADRERGYQLVNAERELVLKIIKDPKFKVLALEDPELQEKVMRKFYFEQYLQWLHYTGEISLIESKPKKSRLDELELRLSRDAAADGQAMVGELLPRFGIETDEDYDKFMTEVLKEGGIDWADIKKRDDEDDLSFVKRIKKITDPLVNKTMIFENDTLDLRSQVGAKIIFDEVRANGSKVSVIVFGEFHVPGIVEELKKLGDCSIVII